jgi:hypothetical protein
MAYNRENLQKQFQAKQNEKDSILQEFEKIKEQKDKEEIIVNLSEIVIKYMEKDPIVENLKRLGILSYHMNIKQEAEAALKELVPKFHSLGQRLVALREECYAMEEDLRKQGLIA